MPQFDISTFASQLFWLAVTFCLLYLLMSRSVLPRIHDVLEKRRNRITQDLTRAESLSEEAEEARREYEGNYEEARSKASLIIADASASMKRVVEEKRRELEKESDERVAKAVEAIAKKAKTARNQLAPVADEVANAIVERLLGESVEPARAAKSGTRK